MKNKKTILGIVIAIIAVVIITMLIINAKSNKQPEAETLLEAVLNKNNKTAEEANYKKFVGGEVLTENTVFTEYAFATGNTIYIFDPAKLEQNIVSYKKVYDIPENIKLLNLHPSAGADIYFIDDKDNIRLLYNNNLEFKGIDYEAHEKAVYELRNYTQKSYTEDYYGKKIDYDFITNYTYSKNNILYKMGSKEYDISTRTVIPAETSQIKGNYEGEKIIKIYNERLLKTNKVFYEILNYYDDNRNIQTTTMKIDLLSKYYNEVLTFTYEYVVLKDYTLIPLNDVITRATKYQYNYYYQTLETKPESFVE